jgi:hypothetical protein
MRRQRGQVHLEQSDMRLALKVAKIAKGGVWCGAIDETQCHIPKPRTEIRDVKKWHCEFARNKMMVVVSERHLAMLRQNNTTGYLPCQYGTTKNLPTRWRYNGTGAPPPTQRR